jgi:hypothetical protein
MSNRDSLLVEREKTHGLFETTADISQDLKNILHSRKQGLPSTQREALDMIATKIARILSGQANFKDHWKDLSGYSLLGMEACSDDK